ncbi:MAG: hypothetical protein IKA12_02900 [Clostridia bacterium]|nr:hypothetical protein [Clostridia bacterium]
MAKINVDLSKVVGKIKPMHGVGQPPLVGHDTSYFKYMKEAGIPYSRLHDVGGPYGGYRWVDIPNIFRDFDADENDPNSYDFAFTDILMKALVDNGVEPYYRLGITIENASHIRAYRTQPPKDYEKWARICEHIIMHYNEGWANGFHFNIKYWEIWNEPESEEEYHGSTMMWDGLPIDFFRLYEVASKHLKSRFPNIKIGGYGSCGFYALHRPGAEWPEIWLDYFHKFFKYIKEHNCPIDFFSWHSYSKTATNIMYTEYLQKKLEEFGYSHIETHLNEWHAVREDRGLAHHSAEAAANMIAMQNSPVVHVCNVYDMRITGSSGYNAIFNLNNYKPFKTFYSFVAFNKLYQLKNQVESTIDTEDMYVLTAKDGEKTAMLIVNLSGKKQPLEINGLDLTNAKYHVIDDDKTFTWVSECSEILDNGVVLITID